MGAETETGVMQKLQTALNNYLRVLAGAPLSTPITLLQSYTGIPPVEVLMERTIAANFSLSLSLSNQSLFKGRTAIVCSQLSDLVVSYTHHLIFTFSLLQLHNFTSLTHFFVATLSLLQLHNTFLLQHHSSLVTNDHLEQSRTINGRHTHTLTYTLIGHERSYPIVTNQ